MNILFSMYTDSALENETDRRDFIALDANFVFGREINFKGFVYKTTTVKLKPHYSRIVHFYILTCYEITIIIQ